MNIELKPCPFCESDNLKIEEITEYEKYIYCRDCCCQGPNEETKKHAAEAWNKRIEK